MAWCPFSIHPFSILISTVLLTGDLDRAKRMIDFAAASGSLRAFVVYNEWYNKGAPEQSQYRAVPLIDTEKFLAAVDASKFRASELEEDQRFVDFGLDWAVPGVESMKLRVLTTAFKNVPVDDGTEDSRDFYKIPCPDLAIISPGCISSKTYPMKVIDNEDDQDVLDFLFNAAPNGSGAAGGGGGFGRRMNYKRPREADAGGEEEES